MTDIEHSSRGRPLIKFDWSLLDKVLARGGRMPDCVYLTGVSASTIERRIREEHDCTFNEYRDQMMTDIRMRILDTQIDVALKDRDSAMLIHLGKQYLGQSEKSQNLNVSTSVEDYLRGLHGQD